MNTKKITQVNIFFCPSWLQIEEIITLTIKYKKSFIFVLENRDLYVFFKKFYSRSKLILLKPPRTLITVNPIRFIYNFYLNYSEKKRIKLIFNKYSYSKVYCSDGFNLVQMAFAAKILSFKNQLYLYSNKLIINKFYKKKMSLKFFFYNIYIKILYGISCYSVADPDNKLFSVYSDKYYKFISAKKIRNPINILLLKKFIQKKLNFKNKIKILLLSSFEVFANNLIDENKFKIWIKEFAKITNKKNVIFKRKFSNEKKYFGENLFLELPSYLPASLLIYKFDIIIGYSSSTLFQAANVGCKAVSLLDLLRKKRNANFFYVKRYLKANLRGNNKILFPKTINDFKKLI